MSNQTRTAPVILDLLWALVYGQYTVSINNQPGDNWTETITQARLLTTELRGMNIPDSEIDSEIEQRWLDHKKARKPHEAAFAPVAAWRSPSAGVVCMFWLDINSALDYHRRAGGELLNPFTLEPITIPRKD